MSKVREEMLPTPRAARASRIRPVLIKSMRVPEIGVVQRSFSRKQAEAYAQDLDLEKLGLMVVCVRDGIAWVVDGQHRLHALRANGFDDYEIECEVYEDLSDAEMAELFLGRDDRRRISIFDKFAIACTAERNREMDVRRTVEAQGLKVSRAKQDNCVSAVGALIRTYDRTSPTVLGQVLRTIRDAFNGDPVAFDAKIIEGLGLVFNRYNGRTNEKELAVRLSNTTHGARGVLRRAEAQRERTGNEKVQCVAATIVEIYNKGNGARLPDWWKSTAKTEEPKRKRT